MAFLSSIDFTPDRIPLGQDHAIVRSFMAHHQGMILLSIANFLQGNRMVERFHADPLIQSVEILLQEQIPENVSVEQLAEEKEEAPAQLSLQPQVLATPWRVPIEGVPPLVHYLSNGSYSLLITNKGGGYSHWKDRALTRWRADTTQNDWGTWIYLQDLDSGEYWTPCAQMVTPPNSQREVFFSPFKVDFHEFAQGVNTHMQIVIAPNEDVELRLLRINNAGDLPRRFSLTTYGELVLAPQDADRRHPAFNKLVIESEYVEDYKALIFRRRPRAANDPQVYMLHTIVVKPYDNQSIPGYESSRLRFLGRDRTARAPLVLEPQSPGLSGTVGPVLDPIFSMQHRFELAPHGSIEVAIILTAGDSRQAVVNHARHFRDWNLINQVFNQARYNAEVEMRRLEVTSQDLESYLKLLSALLYPQPALRTDPEILAKNKKGQPSLWTYGISGDYPVILLKIGEREDISLLRELLHAHTYWRNRGLQVDLVILTEHESGYGQEVHDRVFQFLIRTNNSDWMNRRGGIFLLRRDQMNEEDQVLIETVARVALDSARGPLMMQLRALQRQPIYLPLFMPVETEEERQEGEEAVIPRPTDLQFDNGWGGFSPDGEEYLIYLKPALETPAPWINVIANPQGGFWVSEAGGGYSWAINSGENRLTPWSNDPVSDSPGEALYLRDEETADVWSPTPLPAGEDKPYLVRHGAGYSIFEHQSHHLHQTLRLFMTKEDPVKVIGLRLENTSRHVRRVTATYYAEWVLGVNRDQMQQYVITDYDHNRYALLARNPYNVEFGERVAFLAACQEPHGLTANRTEFLGRSGSYRRPAALTRVGLSGEVGAGLDPCGAVQMHLDLQPGEAQEVFFLLGEGANQEDSLALIERYQSQDKVEAAFKEVTGFWDELLEKVSVHTPERKMDLILNRWMLYQDLSCRLWGRSALYQSSGAFGFRDQLQDVMALLFAAPEIAREQILRAAKHQFEAGDVLHWWHPPSGRGVRTRVSDDLLWLPYVTAEYLSVTGDYDLLQEKVPFLKGEPLKADEEDRYGEYNLTEEGYSIYEHCIRAIQKGSTAGAHGLPLIGAGDWNDGMNRVGIEGKGESIWLGWFLYANLTRFEPICRRMNDEQQAQTFRQQAEQLRTNLQEYGWDREWYLRAYYDSGRPLGSEENSECKIDSIAQSWAVLSGAGEPTREKQAMQAVQRYLVQKNGQLIELFTPPFNMTAYDPGYIKAYPPGIRENGGQYTHAATWTVWAFALLGEGDLAGEYFKMLNPIHHADQPERVKEYMVEPYVIAADVYSEPPLVGRGGWTWYTGSAGWMYRLGVEAILGLHRTGNQLTVDPCIPADWPGYEMSYQFGTTQYQMEVQNPQGVSTGVVQVTLDGIEQPDYLIPLSDDGQVHQVVVRLGPNGQRPFTSEKTVLNIQKTEE